MKGVLGIGNALVDILVRLEDEGMLTDLNLAKGSMQLIDNAFKNQITDKIKQYPKEQASGGSAANTIHGLARLGIPSGYIGKIGKDPMGDYFQKDLEKNNITPYLTYSPIETGVASAFITPDSERTFGTYLGAAVEISASDLDPNVFQKYQYLHLEGYLVFNQELIEKALQIAKSLGMIVSLDLASYNVVEANLSFLRSITSDYVDIVFANEEEAKSFTGKNPEEALEEIATLCRIAVVKIGKHGSLIKNGPDICKVEAIPSAVIDTTGAGDLYASGFLYGLLNYLPIQVCGQIGSLCAGKVIEQIGAKITEDDWKFIHQKIKELAKNK